MITDRTNDEEPHWHLYEKPRDCFDIS